jgi:hypothetical protein
MLITIQLAEAEAVGEKESDSVPEEATTIVISKEVWVVDLNAAVGVSEEVVASGLLGGVHLSSVSE